MPAPSTPEESRTLQAGLQTVPARIGLFELDPATGLSSWDEPLVRIFGRTPEDLDPALAGLDERIHPQDRDRLRAALAQAVATGGTFEEDCRVRLPDGRRRWVTVRGRARRDGAGEAVRVLGAVVDLSDLRHGRTRAEQIMQSMSVGYLAMDGDWRVTYVNEEAVQLLGRPEIDLVGGVLWDLFPETVGTDFEAGYRRAAQTGAPVTFDAYYPAPLDAWYEVRATPEAGGVALYFLDITARRDAEETARRSGERLAALGEVALALAETHDITDLVTTIAERGLRALGADGGAVAVPDAEDPGVLLSYVTASYGPGSQAAFGQLPVDAALPVCEAYTTGRRVIVPDLDAALAYSPLMQQVVESTGSPVYVSVPMRAEGQVIGVLTAGWDSPQPFDAEQLELVETFAAQCAQALQRLHARDAEHAATAAAQQSAEQQAALVAIAMTLDGADSAAAVLEVVTGRGVALLGAQGAVLCLTRPPPDADPARGLGAGTDDPVVLALTTSLADGGVRTHVSELPPELPLPMVHAAVTGTPHHFADRASAVARFPGAADRLASSRTRASAAVPLRAGGVVTGSLSVTFDHDRTWTGADRDLLEAVAALAAQALERISARDAEHAANLAVARFSETLQRSLLSSPPQPEHLQIAVRYSPAATEAEVGGDWYDAFVTAGGVTSIVIGDVTGHDRHAAAAMAQLRNLLRGIGYAVGEPPARVLEIVDQALTDLVVGAMATVVVAHVEAGQAQRETGSRTVRWSNAGHLPPLLLAADGTGTFLTTEPELLLGVDPGSPRTDHHADLAPGSTLLLFTDGLVERRGAHLQAGLDWLAGTAGGLAHLPLEELCDALLTQVGTRVEDDVALLAVRAAPRGADGTPPADAGLDPAAAPGQTDPPGADRAAGRSGEVTETLLLDPDPAEVRRARAFLQRVCEAAGAGPDTTDTAVLLLSEVVTNAFLHGRSQTRLRVSTTPQTIRVEVGDDNSRHPTVAPADTTALQGRGMTMVDLLATAWGVREEELGKTVWFTLTRT